MIDMNFIVQKGQVAGLEFINFQNEDFYVALSKCYKDHISYASGKPVLQKTCADEVKRIMEMYTGFRNITFNFTETGNLYVDTGYFAPGHVINNAGIDKWLDASETSLYRWFMQNKSKIFKGGVDYKTGKVTGSFCDIPVEMGINVNIDVYFPMDVVKKVGVPIEGLMTGANCHELGHVFGGCMLLASQYEDNVVTQAGLEAYRKAKRDEDRVVVLKDAATLLGMPEPKKEELLAFAKQSNDESFLMFFTNMKVQSNNRRALSVGVPAMTSEVIADMYAIRMGCDKGIIAAITTLTSRGIISTTIDNMLIGCISGILAGYIGAVGGLVALSGAPLVMTCAIVGFAIGTTFAYFAPYYSGVYNSDPRRLEDAVRQLIAKLKESKNVPPAVRAVVVADITKLLKVLQDNKKWFDDTGIYRAMGWMFSGADFKYREIEHHTQSLVNNEMTVLAERLKGV